MAWVPIHNFIDKNTGLRDTLYNADDECEHEIELLMSGVKCVKCKGWFCV